MVLRNRLADANLKKQPASFSFDDLNKLMHNTGSEQFDYRTFKAAYDSDERVKKMIKNFNQQGLTLKTDIEDTDTSNPQQDIKGDSAVSRMAKRAVRSRQ